MSDPMSSHLPKSIDIRLTGACNLRCSFCFGPRHDVRATRVDQICALLPILRQHGVRRIVLTGGEPLMVKKLPMLLAKARQLGFHIVLSTNGSLFERRHSDILPFLNWVALPLDGPCARIHDSLRPGRRSSFLEVTSALLLARRLYPHLRIKLGTVLQPGNLHAVSTIPDAVDELGIRPDVWKLYQISFSNYAADNRAMLQVAAESFETTVRSARRAAERLGWTTIVYRNATRNGQYLFVEPSGDAMVIENGEETAIGNFLDGFESVLRRWREHVDCTRLDANAEHTYSID
jgi:radical S-adenosyl methionine domain-containing protein 2